MTQLATRIDPVPGSPGVKFRLSHHTSMQTLCLSNCKRVVRCSVNESHLSTSTATWSEEAEKTKDNQGQQRPRLGSGRANFHLTRCLNSPPLPCVYCVGQGRPLSLVSSSMAMARHGWLVTGIQGLRVERPGGSPTNFVLRRDFGLTTDACPIVL